MSEQTPKRKPGNPAWQPGVSGNPNGRPKLGKSLREAYRHRFPPERIVELAEELLLSAQSESVRAQMIALISDRVEGKVADRLELASGEPEVDEDAMLEGLSDEQLARLAELDRERSAVLALSSTTGATPIEVVAK